MISVITNGVLFGLLLAVMLGPVFFALIQNSIIKGFKAGIYMALGIAIADTAYIFLMYFSVKLFENNDVVSFWMGAAGGFIILITGIMSLRKKSVKLEEQQVNTQRSNFFKQFAKGFILNGINPFVLLYWLGVMTLVTKSYQYDQAEIIVFFTGIIATLLITDFSKVALSHRLRAWVTPRKLNIMNKIVGVALILFSFRLFYHAFEHYN
ncbi:LysE family transporter [Marivirga harenae]|uniref:LysE family translocator n=1 Tax=Marivirga harenae TaxID=2010992 RepID=UPI0026E0E136|nr:LysE family transporter [Marivirga harenae]WKV12458.1 LysE family transporter [Marivirga harenae]|tara:strand:- start:73871 stop:74497 length:627 start_codon:yes stop_codon:yes gene_type:complete